jgi:hypothetical protein
MGRGRQKAKHTKIARELKSFSPDVNYDALERELTGHSHHDDQYAAWADYDPGSDDRYQGDYEGQDQPKRA